MFRVRMIFPPMLWTFIFIAAGFASFWGAWKYRQSVFAFIARSVETRAEIIDIVSTSGSNPSHKSYFPVPRFTDREGDTIAKKRRNCLKKRTLYQKTKTPTTCGFRCTRRTPAFRMADVLPLPS